MARGRFRQLQLLTSLADNGTMRQAAEDVGLSQPAATQAIKELERLLDVELFERHAHGMRLTQAGKVVLPVAREVTNVLRTSTEMLAEICSDAIDSLRVGITPALVVSELGELLAASSQMSAEIKIRIVEGISSRLFSELATGGLDALLTRCSTKPGQRYRFESLLQDEAVFAAGVEHPLVGQETVSIDELLNCPWVCTVPEESTRALFNQLLANTERTPVLHPISTSSALLTASILKDNWTISIGSAVSIHGLCKRGLAAGLAVDVRFPLPDLGVAYVAEEGDNTALDAFLDFMRRSRSRACALGKPSTVLPVRAMS